VEGIIEEELRNLTRYRESDVFDSTEKLVLDLAVAMTRTPPVISDELFGQLQEQFTTAQLVELVNAIANENLKGRFNRVFRCEPAGFSEGTYCPMPELPAP
jgi:alkylhydroperoxidase family enzyme